MEPESGKKAVCSIAGIPVPASLVPPAVWFCNKLASHSANSVFINDVLDTST